MSINKNIDLVYSACMEFISAQVSENPSGKAKDFLSSLKSKSDEFKDCLKNSLKTVLETKTRASKLKDPNAPKKPKNAYMFFCEEKRAANKGKLDFGTFNKQVSEQWKSLSDKEKQPYTKKAARAKSQYETAMESYERPSDEELLALNVNKKRGGKSVKDPNAPKRGKSAYIFFCQDMREKVKSENPDMKASEVMAKLGELWNGDYADAKSRQKWIKQADKDKKRYEEEKSNYVPSKPEKTKPQPKKGKSNSEEEEEWEEEDVEEEVKKPSKVLAHVSKATMEKITKPSKITKKISEEDLFSDDED